MVFQYVTINLTNNTTQHLTLNSVTIGETNDPDWYSTATMTIDPGATAQVVSQTMQGSSGCTWNIDSATLLQCTWSNVGSFNVGATPVVNMGPNIGNQYSVSMPAPTSTTQTIPDSADINAYYTFDATLNASS